MDLDKYRALFLDEAREHAGSLARELGHGPPFARPAIDSLFRHAHSIKGMAASMGLEPIRELAHGMEDLLGLVRAERSPLEATLRDALLAATDHLGSQLDAFARGLALPAAADALAMLRRSAGRADASAAAGSPGGEPAIEEPPELLVEPVPELPPADAAPLERSTIRVETRFIDSLLERVTDLVLSHGALRAGLGPRPPEALLAPLDALRRTLDRLREDTMAVRLMRFDAIAADLARAARETASHLGKRVAFSLSGGSVSLDRSVIDALVDPLVHVIRNAVDHGLEPPAERALRGKPPQGRVDLKVRREADSVYISVRDDGPGMDADRLVRKAIEAGILDPERAARLSRPEALLLATVPGLSTAAEVSHISGRGVGLDLVRARIEGLGGRLEISSAPGAGTEVTLRAPLTLALQRLFLVRAAGLAFALPLARVRGLVDLKPGRIEAQGGRRLARVDDEAWELIVLAPALGLEPPPAGRPLAALLIEARGERWALAVDEAVAERELVVRPLGRPLQRLRPFSAAALLPEGRIALVLDADGLVESATRREAPRPAW